MKKLTLNAEELRVDGFTTSTPEPREGTVIGHFATIRCSNYCTQGESCVYICP